MKEQMDINDEKQVENQPEEKAMDMDEGGATAQQEENTTEQYYDTEENLEGQENLETGVESAQTPNPGVSMDTTESDPTNGDFGNYSQDQSGRTSG